MRLIKILFLMNALIKREEAIEKALQLAGAGDIVLLAGKRC